VLRVVVTGGRAYKNRAAVFRVLNELAPSHVAQGGCPTGADHWAREWCNKHGIPCRTFLADWNTFGKRAGPIHNRRMIDEFKPNIVAAFPGGKGTANCLDYAMSCGRGIGICVTGV
jgi:hypothetical protein